MSNLKGLKIAHLNIVSLLADGNCKIEMLRMALAKKPVDILCLNETRLSDKISSDEIAIDGYTMYRHDRNRKGGGVAMYVSKDLQSIHKCDYETIDVESMWI